MGSAEATAVLRVHTAEIRPSENRSIELGKYTRFPPKQGGRPTSSEVPALVRSTREGTVQKRMDLGEGEMRFITHTLILLLAIGLGIIPTFSAVSAFQPPRLEEGVLPDFDSRTAGGARVTTPSAVTQAVRRLEILLGSGVAARFHPFTGGVRLLRGSGGSLSAPRNAPARQIALDFLAQNKEVFGLNDSDLANLVVTREYSGRNETITHILFEQVAGGVRVFGAALGVHVNNAGERPREHADLGDRASLGRGGLSGQGPRRADPVGKAGKLGPTTWLGG